MSNKMDGVRVFWDGVGKLYLRRPINHPKEITTPAFFTKEFPNVAFEGELLYFFFHESSNQLLVLMKRIPLIHCMD